MSAPRHLMILASAGSGKTYALTSRFVRLLAEGARPERVVALTFTRKAAGEFFDEILRKLAGAAADPRRAETLAHEIGHPGTGCERFLGLLRGMIDAMPRLRLGTLDSFFARIVRAFPLELGLAGDFELLQEHAARLERRRVLRRMFARAGELGAAQRDFIEAFKRATFGREEKRLGAQLDAFLDNHQEIYLAAPGAERWGNPARIWPQGCAWLPPGRREEAQARLRAALPWTAMNDAQRTKWEDFLAELEDWSPGADWGDAMKLIVKNSLAAWPDLQRGSAEIVVMRRRLALDAPACAALAGILHAVIGAEIARRLETTRGIHAVVRGYEEAYHAAVRRAGRLTFADVQRLLAPGAGTPVLSRSDSPERLFIDYRLDAEIDHWLLDEFQDTSFGQWSVLKNLIDEAVQDPTATRSFFCVGDVKQAIYTWREGDPRLFREILRHYTAAAPGAIATQHLDVSHRSGPAVVTMVNRVFGNAPALTELFPGPMSATWNAEWRDHVSAVPERTGQSAWLLAADASARRETVLALLRELRPLERGLSCAVLVQTNSQAVGMADFLRQAGDLPAVAESDLPVCTDNPLGAALLALVQAAAHPGDTLAWEHVRMTPFRAVLEREGICSPEELTRNMLGRIHEEGFERTVAHWLAAVEPALAAADRFSRERARQLADAARLFDATGSRDAAEFVAFMERHTVREPEGAAVIRVMTIHKAKGLGFDVVLLPELEGTRLDQARDGLAVHKAGDRSVDWVLEPPPRLVVQSDEVLAAHLQAAEAEAGYEALALLYVALTRAKRGLYVITKPRGSSESRNYPCLLAATLGGGAEVPCTISVGALQLPGVWSEGGSRWHEVVHEAAPAPAPTGPRRIVEGTVAVRRLQALRPSVHEAAPVPAGRMFTLQNREAADFGIAVHRLLAQVEWPVAGAGKRPDVPSDSGHPEAEAEVAAVLAARELAGIWTKPAADRVEVWRERAFEMVWDQAWVTGVMDRVVVERAADGRALRATVYDFKTDRLEEEDHIPAAVRRHESQMRLYRQAAARLTGLAESSVQGVLVFTRLRRAVAAGS
jgi:ATP-dependent helicase/nuclease subunit A